MKFRYFATWPFTGVPQNSHLEKSHKGQRKAPAMKSFFRKVTYSRHPGRCFSIKLANFFRTMISEKISPKRLALFISQLTEAYSEPSKMLSHTSKMERFAKIVNGLPAVRLNSQHVSLHNLRSEILEN